MRTILALLLTAVCTCACTTMRVVAPGDLRAAVGRLQPGDSIAVRTSDVWHKNLTVIDVSDASIQAESPIGERITLAEGEIAVLQIRTPAPGKTAALAASSFVFCCGSVPGLSFQ